MNTIKQLIKIINPRTTWWWKEGGAGKEKGREAFPGSCIAKPGPRFCRIVWISQM